LPVSGSSAQVLPTVAWLVIERRSVWPAAVNSAPDSVARAACSRSADAGALIHPGLAVGTFLVQRRHVGVADRARRHPRPPADGVLVGPLAQVEVEAGTVIRCSVTLIRGAEVTMSCPSTLSQTTLVAMRCFQAVTTSAGRCSDAMPGWWISRSRQNSRPRV
jgi:hypothetical protein